MTVDGDQDVDVDVVVVGAGPVGLTLANILGLQGVSTLVVEERDTLIDYPRGVGLDDEYASPPGGSRMPRGILFLGRLALPFRLRHRHDCC